MPVLPRPAAGTVLRRPAVWIRTAPALVDRRLGYVLGALALVLAADLATPLSWVTVLVILVVVAAPSVLFEGFWRILLWVRADGIARTLWARRQPDWRGRPLLWLAFATLWAADVLAATAFFHVPGIRELNPVTVAFYQIGGEPGVLLAGLLYAAAAVLVSRRLSPPADVDFLLGLILAYVLFALNNYLRLYWLLL